MRRLLASIAAVVLSSALAPAVAVAAPEVTTTSTTLVTLDGRLALALWSLDDAYHTSVLIAGNDFHGVTQTSGSPALTRYSGFLVAFSQSYCDTTTDQLVSRSISYIVNAAPSTVVVSGSLERARIFGTGVFSGYEQRVPSCSNPDYYNRTITFPDITVTANLTFTQSGDVVTYSAGHLHDFSSGSGGVNLKFDARGRPATVTGSVVTSLAEAPFLSVPAGAYASMAGNSELVVQVSH